MVRSPAPSLTRKTLVYCFKRLEFSRVACGTVGDVKQEFDKLTRCVNFGARRIGMMGHCHRHEAVAKAVNLAIGSYREILLITKVIQECMRSGLSMAGVALRLA